MGRPRMQTTMGENLFGNPRIAQLRQRGESGVVRTKIGPTKRDRSITGIPVLAVNWFASGGGVVGSDLVLRGLIPNIYDPTQITREKKKTNVLEHHDRENQVVLGGLQ